MDAHSLNTTDPTAICLDGKSPDVFAYVSPKPSKQWVILLGTTSVGFDICISEEACALYGKQPLPPHAGPPGPPPPPPPPPSPVPLAQGPQSRDCTVNPDWCTANHASIPLCDFTLGLSDMEEIVSASGCPIAGTCCAKPTMAFRGRRILAAAIKRLAALGMSGAEEVLLTGVGFGGTSAILNADFFAEQLKLVAKGLKVFKVLPVDAIHPKDPPTFAGGPLPWLGPALRNLDSLANLTATSSHPACVANNSADPSVCLYPAVALSYVKTPIFVVQEFPSVWDTQCLFDGSPTTSILQLECSSRNAMYNCAQYSDLCPKDLIQNFFLPVQKDYVEQTNASGLPTRPGSGGFFHTCYLGAYFFGSMAKNYTECYPPPCSGKRVTTPEMGIWSLISVGGKTMQAAISEWWKGAENAAPVFVLDELWDPDGTPPPNQNASSSTFAAAVSAPVENRRRMLADADADYADADYADHRSRVGAKRRRGPPPVPWYVSRYMQNPSCRGFPWY